MAGIDRRLIAPLLLAHFPGMADTEEHQYTSDEWHGFMNAMTGLSVDLDEANATAFDKWRQALAERGIPVWRYTEEQKERIRQRGEDLKRKEEERKEEQAGRLRELAAAAPTKTAADIIADTKKAARG